MNRQHHKSFVPCDTGRVITAPSSTADSIASEIEEILTGVDITNSVIPRIRDWSEKTSVIALHHPQILLMLQGQWIRKVFTRYEAHHIVVSTLEEIHLGLCRELRYESIQVSEILRGATV